jgi:hypothetical protein
MGIRDERLGFRIATVTRGDAGALATVMRFQCVECGELLDLIVSKAAHGNTNPEVIAQRAGRFGWKADAYRKNRCWCPRCAGPRKPKPAPVPIPEQGKVIPMTQAVPIREITAAQKQRVRSLLDKHFDDSIGAYLDGMTDLKVAEALGIPRTFVEQIRDAAYGPIRISPELSDARAALEALDKKIASAKEQFEKRTDQITKNFAKEIVDIVVDLTKTSTELSKRLDRIAAGKAA